MAPRLLKNPKRLIPILAWLAIFIFGIIIQFIPTIGLRISTAHGQGLEDVAQATAIDGFLRRRVVNDVVWLPVGDHWSIFLYDRIYTGPNSHAELELNDGGLVRLRPRTLIQIDRSNGILVIDLLQGEIEVPKVGPKGLTIRSGRDEKTIRPESKTTLAHFKMDGITLDEMKSNAADQSPPENHPEIADESTPTPSPTPLANPYSYPQNGIFLLIQKTKIIKVLPTSECISTCQVTITFNGTRVVQKTFAAHARPEIPIKVDANDPGDFKVEFADDDTKSVISFFVRARDGNSFSEAIDRKAPVEILD